MLHSILSNIKLVNTYYESNDEYIISQLSFSI